MGGRLRDWNTEGVIGSRPVATAVDEGSFYYATDEDILYRSDGSSWTAISSAAAGIAAHEADVSSAHTAEGVDIVDAGGLITATNVEDALQEMQGAIDADEAALTAHAADADAHAMALDDLTDVDAPSPSDGQALVWNDYTGAWEADDVAAGAIALDDLSDVDAPSPSDGQVLKWNDYTGAWEADDESGGGVSALDDLTDVDAADPEDGQVLAWNDYTAAWEPTDQTGAGGTALPTKLGIVLDSPEADDQVDIIVPFDCTITGVTLLADQSGDIVVDIWKDSYANFPPTDADSITASAPPTLSSAAKSEDTTLSGWTTALSAGDILRLNVDSVATVTRVTLMLDVEASTAGGLITGTSFPGSLTAGDRYRRSDLDYMVFFCDGTRWLSEEQFVHMFWRPTGLSGTTAVVDRMFPGLRDIYIEDLTALTYYQTGGGTGNHLTCQLQTLASDNTYTDIGSELDLHPAASATWETWGPSAVDTFIDVSAYPVISIKATETGTASATFAYRFTYRLVAT